MIKSKEVRPGESISLVIDLPQRTRAGVFAMQGAKQISYDQLVQAFLTSTQGSRKLADNRQIGKEGKKTRNSSAATRFSRIVALNIHAIRTGRWTNGTRAMRSEAINNLVQQFKTLPSQEYRDVSSKAWQNLKDLKPDLKQEELDKLSPIFSALKV
jgi:hypothetical protein